MSLKEETAQEKARGNNNSLSQVPPPTPPPNFFKSGTSGCGLFAVAYFQPATSIDRLHYFLQHIQSENYTVSYLRLLSIQAA